MATESEYAAPFIGAWISVNDERPPEGATVLGCWGKVYDDAPAWDIEACVWEDEEWTVRGSSGTASPDYWAPVMED